MTGQAAPAAILVHGFLDSGEVWRPVLKLLGPAANGWSIPDLPGMGRLWDAEGPFSLARHADAITTLIDQVNGDVVLVGHSMGTQIVELAARDRPQRIAGLCLLSPIPLAGAHAPPELTVGLSSAGGDPEAQLGLRRQASAPGAKADVIEWLGGLGRKVKRTTSEQLVSAWNEGVAEGKIPSAFEGPTLLATGEADFFATPPMAKEIATRFRNASVVTIPDAGHWPHAENPEFVAKILSDFIIAVAARTGASKARGGWAQAFGDRSEESFTEKFDEAVVFEASAMTRRVEGRERVATILGAASKLYETLEFTHRAQDSDHSFMEWKASLHGGEPVTGVTILKSNANGKIVSIAIHHRPLPGLLRFSSELRHALAGKIEPDLFFGGTEGTSRDVGAA
jgi:pimeloyl-ACP methyl ester carboxylesterase